MLGARIYCSYYDVFYMLCDSVKDCPENLDDEYETYEEDDGYNSMYDWDEDYK